MHFSLYEMHAISRYESFRSLFAIQPSLPQGTLGWIDWLLKRDNSTWLFAAKGPLTYWNSVPLFIITWLSLSFHHRCKIAERPDFYRTNLDTILAFFSPDMYAPCMKPNHSVVASPPKWRFPRLRWRFSMSFSVVPIAGSQNEPRTKGFLDQRG